ncbi:MAG: hypothetical protein ACRYG7_08045 [Janthinobacterium lividum]
MKHLLLALAGAASLTACSSDNPTAALGKDVLMHNDFESMVGWIPDPVALTQEKAHSGQYSIKVDQEHEYSLGYNYLLGQLSPTRIRGVRVEAWVYAPDHNPSAQIRVALNNAVGGATIMNDGIEFGAQVKDFGKWVKVSKEISFPPTANYTSQLVIYLWRGGSSSKAFMDDIQLTALR